MKKTIVLKYLILLLVFIVFTTEGKIVYADGWWNPARNWIEGGQTNITLNPEVLDELSSLIEIVGTGVIAIATVTIGIRYVLGTVEGKVQAKESLVNLLVACIFFFGWSGIRGMIISGSATAKGGYKLSFFDGNLSQAFARIFTLLLTIGKTLTVIAIMYMGVKYVFAGADAKAQLKEKTPKLIIGTILIFCATTVLGIIANVITEVL